MQQKTVFVVLLVLLVGGGLVYVVTKTLSNDEIDTSLETVADTQGGGDVPHGMHRMPDGSLMAHEDMMMDHSDMLVTSERAFIEGMIPHHQEAIDTSREVLDRGGSTTEIRELAENIITAQESEIIQMMEWYEDWYGEVYQDTGEYVPMMRDLSQLSGVELDRVFLEDMVIHHIGAIMMAENIEPYIEREKMYDLITAIIETQTDEIALMQKMLSEL